MRVVADGELDWLHPSTQSLVERNHENAVGGVIGNNEALREAPGRCCSEESESDLHLGMMIENVNSRSGGYCLSGRWRGIFSEFLRCLDSQERCAASLLLVME